METDSQKSTLQIVCNPFITLAQQWTIMKTKICLLSFRASIDKTLSVYWGIIEQGIPETSKKSTEYA